jgi:hypothetical protein
MSVQALVQFKQGMSTGVPGQAYIGVLTTPVTIVNSGAGDPILHYTWTWVDVPHTSAIPRGIITQGNVPQVTFVPDVVGDYHIELHVIGIDGAFSTDRRVFRVVRVSGRAIPAFDAEAPAMNFGGRARGWAVDLEVWLEYLDSLVLPTPGGMAGYVQFDDSGSFGGTSLLTVTGSPAFLTFTGKSLHEEDYNRFVVNGASGSEARSYWFDTQTTDASAHVLGAISLPAATYGDCIITLVCEASVRHSGGGGNRALKASYRRASGTLTKIGETDLSSSTHWTGTVVADMSTSNPDNDTIDINGTGIAVTNVRWFPSVHVILAKS